MTAPPLHSYDARTWTRPQALRHGLWLLMTWPLRGAKRLVAVGWLIGCFLIGPAQLALADGRKLLVLQIMGRLFMGAYDDPFRALEGELARYPLGAAVQAIVIDLHAEATSEKMALGHLADGRASLVAGSHTHVPTADAQILPGGTAYITDIGMTGDYDSVIGMDKEEPLTRFLRKISGARFEPAMGPATLCGLAVETDDATGLARRVAAVRLGGRLEEAQPTFWE